CGHQHLWPRQQHGRRRGLRDRRHALSGVGGGEAEMATARLFVRWLVLVLVLALAPAGARAEESGGRSLDVTAATLAPQIAGEAAPLGFHFLRVEFRFANTGTAPIADVALGR